MENSNNEVRTIDIVKHYLASVLIYGLILFGLVLCPAYYETVDNDIFDYSGVFAIYFIAYFLFAPVIFAIFKPKSILESRSLTILGYFTRQFKKGVPVEDFLKNIEPNEKEKKALMTLFVQVFFGAYCVNTLCNNYLLNLGYNIDFLKVMFDQAVQYASTNGIYLGLIQYLIDTGDMWLKLILTVNITVLAISYLSELTIFKNKIKSVDTTPLGVLCCIACYYPVTLLTYKFLQVTEESLLPVKNQVLLAVLNLLIIIVNIGSMFAILRLGTKSGNLTNRGIVTGFPYNIVRHPDYIMQIFYIILTTIPLWIAADIDGLSKIIMTIATLGWIFIYYLRAVTEERHLIQDPEYQKYIEKVKYRFIPKIF